MGSDADNPRGPTRRRRGGTGDEPDGLLQPQLFSGVRTASYLTSSAQITLGCAYPLALGAKMATPRRAVVSLSGDGGFLYNAQEMATAVQNSIGAIAVVFNDNAYGNVLRAQLEQFGGNVIGTRLHNPDFVDLAESFGMRAQRVDGATELGDALTQAIGEDAPALIEVPVNMMDREY